MTHHQRQRRYAIWTASAAPLAVFALIFLLIGIAGYVTGY